MSDSKQKNNNSSLDWLIQGTNWGALFIMVTAMLLLLLIMAKIFLKDTENNAPKKLIIKYELKIDTIPSKSKTKSISIESIKQIDENNKLILEEINKSVQAQYTRMESILTVQEDKSKLFTYGAGFLTILVALATFFGFKSIYEMKKGTMESAEYEARKIAEDVAKKIAKDVSEEKTKEEILNRFENIKNQVSNELHLSFKEELSKNELIVSDDFTNQLRKEFDEKITKLNEELSSKIEKESSIIENNEVNPVNKETSSEAKDDSNTDGDLFTDGDLEN